MALIRVSFILALASVVALVNAAPKNLDDEQEEKKTYRFAHPAKNVTANRGDTVTFNCEVTAEDGTPIPVDEESVISIWLRNKLVQMVGSQRINKNPRLSVEGRNLIVSDVDVEDQGEYTCQLSTWNEPTLVHQLIVHTPPSVKAEKPKIIATSGDDVVLSCSAQGSPKPTITWITTDDPMVKGESSLKGHQLSLEQVSPRQAGKYVCRADNGVGEPAKATIELDVMYKPVIKIDKEWIHSGENNQAELTCVIHGQPNPQVKWFRNGVELETDSPRWSQTKSGESYTLELKNLKREDFGTYECRASNTIGKEEGIIELSGVAKKAVFTSAPNGHLEDSYKLTWKVESYSPIKEYLLKYRKVDLNATNEVAGDQWMAVTVPKEKDSNDASGHHHEHAFTLKNLEKATEYEVSLQVVNSFGSNRPSIFRFATLGSTVSTLRSSAPSTGVHFLAFAPIIIAFLRL